MASWNAKGRLLPFWSELPGKRDGLAARTGIRGPELSAYNSGKRNLGIVNARRIAAALGVTLEDLGEPSPSDPPSPTQMRQLVREEVLGALEPLELLLQRLLDRVPLESHEVEDEDQ